MRLHRFFIDERVGNRSELTIRSAELVNQIKKVFRLRTGDNVVLFDGSGSDYECTISEGEKHGKDMLSFDVLSSSRSRYMPSRQVVLYSAIVKKDNFELIVEKATELGVTDIIPVMAVRTEKKSLNEIRLKKIAEEASEQSGRGDVPKVSDILTLEKALEQLSATKIEQKIAFHTEAGLFDRSDIDKDQSISVFIGPEGGFTPEEIELFKKHNVSVVSLGNQVLRAETAVVAALSLVIL